MRHSTAKGGVRQAIFPEVLDACCGPRGMWFDKDNPLALFVDRRACEVGEKGERGSAHVVVAPDVVGDFRELPFAEETFRVVVMDPPHVFPTRTGQRSRIRMRYGVLPPDWAEMLRLGFFEAFRVLKPGGVLVFKWAEVSVPIAEVVALAPCRPLFGHKTSRTTRWLLWYKAEG